MIIGPKPSNCPDCGSSVIQFLVGRGAFCLDCGRLRGKIKDPSNPWVTVNSNAEPADRLPIDEIKARAVGQCLDGTIGPIHVSDSNSLTKEQILEGISGDGKR